MEDQATNLEELMMLLKKNIGSFKVMLMPDFFTDHLVRIEDDFEIVIDKIKQIVSRGGGNIAFNKQSILRGGNAGNLASALATLGQKVTLVTKTNPTGKKLIEHFLGPLGVDLSLISDSGEMSATVAMEFKYKNRLVNVMFSDPGSLSQYGPEKLPKEIAIRLKSGYSLVSLLNWNQNQRATELAKEVFKIAKTNGSLTFLDTGDLSLREKNIPELIDDLLASGLVDIFAFNENEALCMASYYDKEFSERRKNEDVMKLAPEALRLLTKKINSKLCMHTPYFAMAIEDLKEYRIPSFNIEPLRATGSGDTWNSGFISGILAGLSIEKQILLGHSVAGAYLINPLGNHPKPADVIEFIKKNTLRK
ncbi:MAG: PfkB family carbohydrate kinase [Actinomycetota bacterium]|nr:PfkB family carbohydrate kinase [Actinomycetota bacterium]